MYVFGGRAESIALLVIINPIVIIVKANISVSIILHLTSVMRSKILVFFFFLNNGLFRKLEDMLYRVQIMV